MQRTQIYLTREEHAALRGLARIRGCKQSELVREAVDQYVVRNGKAGPLLALERAAGLWKDRDDLPDFRALRQDWDRG